MYWPGKDMLIADALSHYAPLKAPEIPLDITINHVNITPDKKLSSRLSSKMICYFTVLLKQSLQGWPDDINDVSHALHPYHGHRNILTVEDGLILQDEALIIPPLEREKILQAIHVGTWESASAKTELDTVYTGPESTQTSNILLNHAQHANVTAHRNHNGHSSQHQPHNGPWQLHGADYFHFDSSEIPSCHQLLLQDAHHQKNPLHLHAMPQRPSQSWRNSLQNMASQGYSVLTMAPSLPMHSSPSLQQTGSFTITPVYLGILEAMFKLKQPWDCQRIVIHANCSGQDPT